MEIYGRRVFFLDKCNFRLSEGSHYATSSITNTWPLYVMAPCLNRPFLSWTQHSTNQSSNSKQFRPHLNGLLCPPTSCLSLLESMIGSYYPGINLSMHSSWLKPYLTSLTPLTQPWGQSSFTEQHLAWALHNNVLTAAYLRKFNWDIHSLCIMYLNFQSLFLYFFNAAEQHRMKDRKF